MVSNWEQNILTVSTILRRLSIRDRSGQELMHDEAIQHWKELALRIRNTWKTVFFVGNGASASLASHFAADIAKNAGVRSKVFTDLSLITAVANDLCYEDVYAEPLRWDMNEGDMLVAISSSGNSPNIVRAVEMTRSLGGIAITLSAMREDNRIRKMGDLNFYVPAQTYGLAETAHAAILHYWMDTMEQSKEGRTV